MQYDNIVIDGSHLAFRNFHIFRRYEYNGQSTGMIYGFVNSLLKVKADYGGKLYVTWEGGSKHRKELDPEYKNNRKPMKPDDYHNMTRQLKIIRMLLAYLGVSQIQKDGFEADDMCATLARTLPGNILVVTGDHDLQQLINDRVHILKPISGGYSLIDQQGFMDSMHFHPSDYIYVLSLTGDKGDNIPGISGVGEKTALDILKESGESLRKFLREESDDIVSSRAPLLLDNKEVVRRAYKLTMLKTVEDVDHQNEPLDQKAVYQLFDELGFVKFKQRWKDIIGLGK